MVFLVPEENLRLFIATNADAGTFLDEVESAFLDRFFPQEGKPAPNADLDTVDARQYEGRYRYVQYGRHTVTKITSLMVSQIRVRANPDGPLTVTPTGMGDPYGGFEEEASWIPAGPYLFQRADGGGWVAFSADDKSRITHLFAGQGYHATFERVAWYQSGAFHAALAGGFLLLFQAGIALWVLGGVRPLTGIAAAPWDGG